MFRGVLRGDGHGGDSRLEDVVVKVLDVGGLPDWRDYERFRRQGDILCSLSHPRIPRARGEFEVGSRVLHCQTLVAGRSLARQLRGARMSPAEVTRLCDELLQVLDYLHGRDVVHRDIKPDNVVIAPDGGAHVIDFGAARRLHVAGKLDPEPTVVGTPGYMAPEQTRGELVPQSDLYALGRLLIEALGGAEPERPLAALLPLLCKEDWRKRPASAAAALKLLRPRIDGGRRNWWPVAAAASIALVAAVGVARLRGKTQAGRPGAPRPRRSRCDPAAPSLSALASALLYEWSLAQHARDMERYGRCYAPDFKGIRRTPGGKVFNLDRAAWLTDRARIYAQPVELQTADVHIDTDETDRHGGDHAAAALPPRQLRRARPQAVRRQARRRGDAVHVGGDAGQQAWLGRRRIRVAGADAGGGLQGRVRSQQPQHLVVLSSHADYAEALRAAAKRAQGEAARRDRPGRAVRTDLGTGFWVLAGATRRRGQGERAGGARRRRGEGAGAERRIHDRGSRACSRGERCRTCTAPATPRR